MKKLFALVIISTGLMSWEQSDSYQYKNLEPITQHEITAANLQDDTDGYTLMKNNCYVCHNPNTKSHDDIIAPPFKAVKMHYKRIYDTKEGFVTAVVNWVQNPAEDKAVMSGAVKRFEIMPKLLLETKKLEKIAAYIYDNDTEDPEWIEAHMKEKKDKGTGKKRMGKGKKGMGKGMHKQNF